MRSQNQFELTFVTWSSYPKWLEASSVSTMARPSTRLRSSLKWLVTTLLSSQSHTSPSSTVDLVLVLPIHLGSFPSSEGCQPTHPLFLFLRLAWIFVFFTEFLKNVRILFSSFLDHGTFIVWDYAIFDCQPIFEATSCSFFPCWMCFDGDYMWFWTYNSIAQTVVWSSNRAASKSLMDQF